MLQTEEQTTPHFSVNREQSKAINSLLQKLTKSVARSIKHNLNSMNLGRTTCNFVNVKVVLGRKSNSILILFWLIPPWSLTHINQNKIKDPTSSLT